MLEEEYTVIVEEKRIAKEKAEKAANEMQKMAKAATVIQVAISSSYRAAALTGYCRTCQDIIGYCHMLY